MMTGLRRKVFISYCFCTSSIWQDICQYLLEIKLLAQKELAYIDSERFDLAYDYIIQLQMAYKVLLLSLSQVLSNSLPPHGLQLQASLSFTISQSLLKLMSMESVMPSHHLILCHPLLILPSIFSSIKGLQISWLLTSGGQSTGASATASVLPMNIQG